MYISYVTFFISVKSIHLAYLDIIDVSKWQQWDKYEKAFEESVCSGNNPLKHVVSAMCNYVLVVLLCILKLINFQ